MHDPSFKVKHRSFHYLLTVFFERSYYQASLSSVSELRVRVLFSRPASEQFDLSLVPDIRDDIEEG